ncbi:MAG: TraR/DksA C4-type zinc finger protein [Alphaproteobacteria bacterium]|nr:TraR/DksA C4-type zinc finger protein [Alphaproteobacteria bacterium]
MLDLETAKRRLLVRQGELEELSRTSAEGRKAVELDQQSVGRLSRMDALQVQAMALEQERRRDIERKRVAAALKRIEVGDYGHCVSCDEPIAPKRLSHDPAVPTCIDCASAKE